MISLWHRILGGLGAIAALLGVMALQRRKGRKEGLRQADEQDAAGARRVFRRVEAQKEQHNANSRDDIGDDDLIRLRDELRGRQDR